MDLLTQQLFQCRLCGCHAATRDRPVEHAVHAQVRKPRQAVPLLGVLVRVDQRQMEILWRMVDSGLGQENPGHVPGCLRRTHDRDLAGAVEVDRGGKIRLNLVGPHQGTHLGHEEGIDLGRHAHGGEGRTGHDQVGGTDSQKEEIGVRTPPFPPSHRRNGPLRERVGGGVSAVGLITNLPLERRGVLVGRGEAIEVTLSAIPALPGLPGSARDEGDEHPDCGDDHDDGPEERKDRVGPQQGHHEHGGAGSHQRQKHLEGEGLGPGVRQLRWRWDEYRLRRLSRVDDAAGPVDELNHAALPSGVGFALLTTSEAMPARARAVLALRTPAARVRPGPVAASTVS